MKDARSKHDPWILGHRGAPKAAVENTIAAFRAALAEGADGAEFDVRLARCGTLVVGHDSDLSRFTGRATRVRASSAWALSREDLGGGEGVPSLDATLAVLEGTVVNVEVKADDGDPEALGLAVADAARRWRGKHRRFIVSSFEPRVLVALRAAAPEVDRGLLIDPDPAEKRRALSALTAVAPKAIHPHWSEGAEAIGRWRASGYEVHVWTVNDPALAVALANAGATSLITNHPGALRAALQ
jgi:glycerophosphoryl diester phosphodiesterase